MRALGVDPYGIRIMAPKAVQYCIAFGSLSCIAANVLKQEMLSLGGDVALPKLVLTGTAKKTDGLIIGTLSQYRRLCEKLRPQPFGLSALGKQILECISKAEKKDIILHAGSKRIALRSPKIMGVINMTDDSFSGDGLLSNVIARWTSRYCEFGAKYGAFLVRQGADILDIGGESSRQGARSIPLKEEIRRVIPLCRLLARMLKTPISVDTRKPEVAQRALDSGASIINDISGLRDPRMIKVLARSKAAVVVMHMRGTPKNMQIRPHYDSLIEELLEFFRNAVRSALDAGISPERIVIDPGIGFGKTIEHNLEILKRLREFSGLGLPLAVGVSRKSFIGKLTGQPPEHRLPGTIAACVEAVSRGAHILRVHDVREVKEALMVSQAIAAGRTGKR